MKLNNKGFAITGILYTLLVLFSLILVSVLAGLSSRLRIMEKSIESLEDDYKLETAVEDNTITKAPIDGKYVFSNGTLECYTYLEKESSLDAANLIFFDSTCNDKKTSLSVTRYYPFSKDGS